MPWDVLASWTVLVPSYALIVVTPGPNLFVLLRAGLTDAGAAIPAAVAGIACGVALAALGALLGSAALLHGADGAVEEVQLVGRIVFAALLARAGWRTLRRAGAGPILPPATPPGTVPMRGRAMGHFRLALLVAVSNPVTLSFFAGFFLGHPEARQGWDAPASCLLAGLMAGGWFALLGCLLAQPGWRRRNAPASSWPGFALGTALIAYAAFAILPAP